MEKIDLDEPLFEMVSGKGTVPFTVRQSFEGICVFGGLGSGKSSGSGFLLSRKFLEKGWGGLILTVKNTDRDDFVERCKMTGRSNDLMIIEPSGNHRFNWLSYLSSKSDGAELTDNIVDVMKTIIKSSQAKGSGGSNDEFWESALDQVLSFSVELAKRAYGSVTIELLYEITQSLPKENATIKPAEGKAPSAFYHAYSIVKEKTRKSVRDWEEKLGKEAIEKLRSGGGYHEQLYNACPDVRQVKHLDDFFLDTYRVLSSKTKSVVDFMISGFLFRMLKEPVFSLFSDGPSTLKPELCADKGKIILVNLPTKQYSKVGKEVALLVKIIWQKVMEARKVFDNMRPVFLFVDEAQEVLHPYDGDFQAVARANRIATVFLSQNLSNYYAVMGGNKPEYKVRGLMGVFGTKIFHANSDELTNEFASNLCGEDWYPDFNEGTTMGKDFSMNNGKSYKLQKNMLSSDFQKMRTGGPENKFFIDGIIHCQGTPKFDGQNFHKISFEQQTQF